MASRFTIEGVFKGTDGFSRVAARVEGNMSKFAGGISGKLGAVDKMNGKVISGFADLAKQAVVVGAVLGGAVALGLEHVVEVGATFEQTITNVGAVMGKNRGQISALEKEAMRLGVVTQFSSTEVAEAMEMMARKGFDSGEILQGIPGVLDAVAASGQGMAEVATVVGSSIRGFGLEAAQAGRVANILAFVAEKTGATITDMGTALSIAAPTAKTLGVSIEDTAAAVGLLQRMGIDASTAGTATATMLAKITKPSSEAAAKMTQLGIKFKDAKGNMLPFTDVLKQFVKAGDKTGGNMDRMAFFAELVGLRGDKAAIALADMSKSGDFDKLANGIRNVGDYAHKVATIRMDTTTGSWKLLTSTVEVLETKLFNLQSGPLRGVIDSTNAWLGANQDLIVSGVVGFIDNAKFAIDAFGHGAKQGFEAARGGLDLFLGPLGRLAAHVLGMGTWPSNVQRVGVAFGAFVAIAGTFLLFAGAVKVARGAMLAFEIAQKAVSLAVAVGRGVMIAYTFVTDGAAIATGLNTAATVAGRIATLASTVALGAKNTVTFIAFAATTRFTFAQVASKVATVAATAATWLWNAAQGAWTAVTGLATGASAAYSAATVTSTGATEAMTTATDLANASMGTFIVTLGVALAAVGALYAAYTQWKGLEAVSGGIEGVKAGLGGVLNGEGYAKGVDDYQNEQARHDAEARGDYGSPKTDVPSPTQSIQNTVRESYTENAGSLNITAPPGYGTQVQQPKVGFRINVQPSGSF